MVPSILGNQKQLNKKVNKLSLNDIKIDIIQIEKNVGKLQKRMVGIRHH